MNFGKVVFDPGHYANYNPGLNGYYEGNAMLKLGLLLKSKGFSITREDGADIVLLGRVKKAKALGANTLISLHTDWIDANNPKSTEGVMVIYSLNRPEDKAIAEQIGKEIAAALGISFRKAYTRPSTHSTPQKPVDYYGILRNGVEQGIEHVFIVEHCNHGQLSTDTEKKLNKIADCYSKMFDMTFKEALDIISQHTGINVAYWSNKKDIDPYFDDLMIKIAKSIKGVK